MRPNRARNEKRRLDQGRRGACSGESAHYRSRNASWPHQDRRPPDFGSVNAAALRALPALLARWLPDGRRKGAEWVAKNPTRVDRHAGSFSINLATGRWADFATGDKGGDVVSLVTYLFGLPQGEAVRELDAMLGLGGRP